jgi:hypothetical protein
MATPREIVRKAVEFGRPPRVPLQLWFLPWAEEHHPDGLRRIREAYPDDIVSAPNLTSSGLLSDPPERYRVGVFKDEWGCLFTNAQSGVIGQVHTPLVADWSDLRNLRTPDAHLDLDRPAIDGFCRGEDRFVLAGVWLRPFERLQFLRTSEALYLDLAERPPALLELMGRVHAFYCAQAEAWARTAVDALCIMDDWGAQSSLLVKPSLWRELFLPLYRDYAAIARRAGKYVFFHSDGYIADIIPDLVGIGVHALNAQVFCMGLDRLAATARGRIAFWGEVDRQRLLAFATPAEVARAVRDVHAKLGAEGGGLIGQCEFGAGARPENVEAVFRTWREIGGA